MCLSRRRSLRRANTSRTSCTLVRSKSRKMVSLLTLPSQRAHSPNMAYTSYVHLQYSVSFSPLGHLMSKISRGILSLGTHEGGMSSVCSGARSSASSCSSCTDGASMTWSLVEDWPRNARLLRRSVGRSGPAAAGTGAMGATPSAFSSAVASATGAAAGTSSSTRFRLSSGSCVSSTYSHLSVFLRSHEMSGKPILPGLDGSILTVLSCMFTQKLVWFHMNSTPS
mmetsp:Transcript_46212/g.88191  ORF Transcript_46212/g.88191 Transcript_46212/m.88191 type:complete len:225 (+) Transcript_46212:1500-2174(+)